MILSVHVPGNYLTFTLVLNSQYHFSCLMFELCSLCLREMLWESWWYEPNNTVTSISCSAAARSHFVTITGSLDLFTHLSYAWLTHLTSCDYCIHTCCTCSLPSSVKAKKQGTIFNLQPIETPAHVSHIVKKSGCQVSLLYYLNMLAL